jgi:integrase/recombinase XerD
MKTIEVFSGEIEGKKRFLIFFRYEQEIIGKVKSIPGARWEHYGRYWHIAGIGPNLSCLFRVFGDKDQFNLQFPQMEKVISGGICMTRVKLPLLDEDNRRVLKKLRDSMERTRYSQKTIKNYEVILRTFSWFISPQKLSDDPEGEANRFITEYILRKGFSESYQNQFISAFKLLCNELNVEEVVVDKVKRPRSGFRLPNILSKSEVKSIIAVTRNLKHRAMISITYACGLRRGEVLNLKLTDIDSDRGLIKINHAKGNRDRVVPLPIKMVEELRAYYRQYYPKIWLFEGEKAGNQYSERSFEEVLKKSVLLARIKKSVTLHWLRHSYATHLHESGVDIKHIQMLLGHKNTKTTEIYTHVSQKSLLQIRSPFEDL